MIAPVASTFSRSPLARTLFTPSLLIVVFSASFALKGCRESKAETGSDAEADGDIVHRHAQGRSDARSDREAQGQRPSE